MRTCENSLKTVKNLELGNDESQNLLGLVCLKMSVFSSLDLS